METFGEEMGVLFKHITVSLFFEVLKKTFKDLSAIELFQLALDLSKGIGKERVSCMEIVFHQSNCLGESNWEYLLYLFKTSATKFGGVINQEYDCVDRTFEIKNLKCNYLQFIATMEEDIKVSHACKKCEVKMHPSLVENHSRLCGAIFECANENCHDKTRFTLAESKTHKQTCEGWCWNCRKVYKDKLCTCEINMRFVCYKD